MLNRVLKTSFPIYPALSYQEKNKVTCEQYLWELYSPNDRLLPFSFLRNENATFTINVLVKDLSGSTALTLSSAALNTFWSIYRFTDGTEIVSVNRTTSHSALSNGKYYLEITDGTGDTYYSEEFTVAGFGFGSQECHLLIEAEMDCLKNKVAYNAVNHLYLQMDIGRPTYKYFQEQTENHSKVNTVTLQKAEKFSNLKMLVPEFICDFISKLPLYDTILVTDINGFNYDIIECVPSINWPEGHNCLADANLEFLTDVDLKTTCCDDVTVRDYDNPEWVQVRAKIEKDSLNWNNQEFPDASNGDMPTSFDNFDKVFIFENSEAQKWIRVYEYQNGGFVYLPELNIEGIIIRDANLSEDYLYRSDGLTFGIGLNSFVPLFHLYWDNTYVDGGSFGAAVAGHVPDGMTISLEGYEVGAWAAVATLTPAQLYSGYGTAGDYFSKSDMRIVVSNHSFTKTIDQKTTVY